MSNISTSQVTADDDKKVEKPSSMKVLWLYYETYVSEIYNSSFFKTAYRRDSRHTASLFNKWGKKLAIL